jgi:LPXTG-motif cell wall-anchored protein
MRKATVAKLSLTAAVGLGTLLGQATSAQAETPPYQPGDKVFVPAPPTTIKPLVAVPVDPDPEPPFDSDLPLTLPEDDCDQPSCDKAPPPQGDPEPECNPIAVCDEITSDPGCTWTHGCPEDPEPECNPIAVCDEITSDPGCNITHGSCDDGGTDGGDEGTDGGDEGTDDGGDETPDCDDTPNGPAELCEEGTDGDETDGGTGGGTLPKTGAEMATWAIAGLGLTGMGAALRKLGKRGA